MCPKMEISMPVSYCIFTCSGGFICFFWMFTIHLLFCGRLDTTMQQAGMIKIAGVGAGFCFTSSVATDSDNKWDTNN